MKEKISDYIKRIRRENGFTNDQLGEMIGKSGRAVEDWQGNDNRPKPKPIMLKHIEKMFGERIEL